LEHRLRRKLGGVYDQDPFDYAVYTQSSPDQRQTFHVKEPRYRWTLGKDTGNG
jgi:hypothetical protein